MTMTFFSSTCALGMMPLWLFILGSFYVDPTQVMIPYVEIIKNLTVFTIPAALGIVLRTCKPEWAEKAKGPVS
jgi:predicted Na+-dependent transporter